MKVCDGNAALGPRVSAAGSGAKPQREKARTAWSAQADRRRSRRPKFVRATEPGRDHAITNLGNAVLVLGQHGRHKPTGGAAAAPSSSERANPVEMMPLRTWGMLY